MKYKGTQVSLEWLRLNVKLSFFSDVLRSIFDQNFFFKNILRYIVAVGVAINACANTKNTKENVNVNIGTKLIMFLGVVSS